MQKFFYCDKLRIIINELECTIGIKVVLKKLKYKYNIALRNIQQMRIMQTLKDLISTEFC